MDICTPDQAGKPAGMPEAQARRAAAEPPAAGAVHIEVLRACMCLRGVDAVDVGAGGGGFARALAADGAHAVGIEVREELVAAGNASSGEAGNPVFMLGRGEKLPFEDSSCDLLCYMFSLHHIPMEVHEAVLAEAVRVLRPSGRLHFSEPLPDDPERSALAALDDETEVRTASHALLASLGDRDGFTPVAQTGYEMPYSYAGFEEYVAVLLRADPARSERLQQARPHMERAFHRLAKEEGGRYSLPQPCRAYHFQAGG